MNNLFAAKLLSQLQAKKKEGGFTLIELLVVVIIIGVLSAVALPQFLSQAARARQSEAETNLGSLNRAQQIYRLENPTFGTIAQLAASGSISISTGDYYTYSDVGTPSATSGVMNATAATTPKDYSDDIANYQAAVFQNSTTGVFASIICRSSSPTADDAAADNTTADSCTGGTEVGS